MTAPVSVRLGEETRRKIARIARRTKVRPATLMRQAIEKMAEQEDLQISPYERIKDLIGVARGGDRTRSTWSSAKIARLLKARRRNS
jgi:predicted DNA-binding protein